ncbi:MAG: universal stress protein [Bacteroidia bacterium]|nr:universal stress protein [Bacteroidia bacterium]
MQTILLPIDFSPPSRHAFQYAARLGSQFGSKVILLHVYSPETVEPFAPLFFQKALMNQQEDIALSHFEELRKDLSSDIAEKISLEFRLIMGPVVQEILTLSEQIKPNLIVMGMRGGNYTLQKIMGTVTHSVIQQSFFPVMAIPETSAFSEIRNIAYATNFEQDDIKAIGQVLQFSRKMKAKVHCIHIRKNGNTDNEYKQQILQKAYQHDLIMDTIDFDTLDYTNVVEGLNHFVDIAEIDLLVLLTHHRGVFSQIFYSSNTRKMALQAKVPLWIFQIGHVPPYPMGNSKENRKLPASNDPMHGAT